MKKRKPAKTHPESFEQLLLESVDEAFTSLGDRSKGEIYEYLELELGIEREKIPDYLEELSDALELIFGRGAMLLEILIMKNLHAKVNAQHKYNGPKWLIPDLTFCKFVLLTKLAYDDPGMIGELNILVDTSEKLEIL